MQISLMAPIVVKASALNFIATTIHKFPFIIRISILLRDLENFLRRFHKKLG